MAKAYGFDKSGMQRVVNATRRVEGMPPGKVPRSRGEGRSPQYDRFLAVITGNASLATNRWKYAWTEVLPDGDTTATRTGGRSGTTSTDYGVNTLEMYHTSTYAWGVATNGTDYPAGFAPRPVGGGGTANTHRYNVVVEMLQVYKPDGTKKFYFAATGSHDGECSA